MYASGSSNYPSSAYDSSTTKIGSNKYTITGGGPFGSNIRILKSSESFLNFTATLQFSGLTGNNPNTDPRTFYIGVVDTSNIVWYIQYSYLSYSAFGGQVTLEYDSSAATIKLYDKNGSLLNSATGPTTRGIFWFGFDPRTENYGTMSPVTTTVSIFSRGDTGQSADSFPYITNFTYNSANVNRISHTGVTNGGSYFKKIGGTTNTYDAKVISLIGYTNGCYVSNDFGNANQNTEFLGANANGTVSVQIPPPYGLNSNAVTVNYVSGQYVYVANSLDYTDIDYCWKWDQQFSRSYPAIYENGVNVYSAYGSTFSNSGYRSTSIYYDGYNIRYYINSTLVRTVARPKGNPLFFEASYYTLNQIWGPFRFGLAPEQGIQGALSDFQGTQGLQGVQGTQGRQGTQGVQGTQGLQGVQGNQGLQGPLSDFQGTQGLQGLQGMQGLQGVQGLDGLFAGQGTQGLIGSGLSEALSIAYSIALS